MEATVIFFCNPPFNNNNMSKSLTQSASGILSMVTLCKSVHDLAKWMVTQQQWKKQKVSILSKKTLSDLQNMVFHPIVSFVFFV